ncbi:hypothetical protein PASE110613_16995 [Paenibacillus sediminis]|uniref:DUF1048 domain-containing protein n=1 Tax=Paenibacillus sediminis TaxID=664909 RepID=A0ABS4H459_9BACL|nr:hypothetical protein [Paenibacillus sediminis]MBP1936895.1 hypothetical protein [Paenibacillus sediminis]
MLELRSWIEVHPAESILCGLIIVMFVWLYIHTRHRMDASIEARLSKVHQTLELYTSASALLEIAISKQTISEDEQEAVISVLEGCKAAPYLTDDLVDLIAIYFRDRDTSHLALLHKSVHREIHKMISEQLRLLRILEQPGWGLLLWKTIRPALPFCLLVSTVLLLWQLILDLNTPVLTLSTWETALIWCRFLSSISSILVIYMLLLTDRRTLFSPTAYLLIVFIAILGVLSIMFLEAAVYLFALQLVVYLLGFYIARPKSRKARPYVISGSIQDQQ